MANGSDDSDASAGAVEEFETRLEDLAAEVEAASTEADLDDVEATLEDIESELEETSFESDANSGEDEEGGEDSRDNLEERVETFREDIEEQRGPYTDDVLTELDSASGSITTNEWTEEGETAVVSAVSSFLETASQALQESFTLDTAGTEEIAATVAEIGDAVEKADLHPDDDGETIGTLLEAAEELGAELDDAQVFGDLEKREQLRRRGFYDVLDPKNRTDFPPEWNAVKLHEAQRNVEHLLRALEMFDSDFMEENVLDALEHLGPESAYDDIQALAQRRNIQPVRILGRIGDDRACEMLEGFLDSGDVELEKTALWSLGAIGARDSMEPVAQRLAADNSEIRSAAARSLGRIGDTRAIDPLEERLETDGDGRVRASAAWALAQIGTERALEVVDQYTDDRSYLVQSEAQKATSL